jgi:hypothetical protein
MNRTGAIRAAHSLRSRKIYTPADFPFEFRNIINFYASDRDFVFLEDQRSILEEGRSMARKENKVRPVGRNFTRRFRALWDYSGLGVLYAKKLGLSATFYYDEKVKFRKEYKKFLNGNSSKFIR